ncbi:hypothetical protein PSECIP111951_03954 [Pseudoalteromonas holothuriae]|uniref:ABC3 transporter permease C-terminal domain-containing protein n=1 Tax=Pseudoalteromonas holothuriae TaxID=2963714 RepID=A0ABM9GN69_9GAMM|nr:FtsX-like permease family protein [Pseudoalteromonas sp. CIP111951]CAH9067964.1 hypothetical protein PSECIP111951_03954 [Pseudoalteromonas sp. CIP111951]
MVSLNNEIKLVIATHIAFYRRHPWLLALFVLGFSLGSALLTAITGLNQEAKTRYEHSSALVNSPVSHIVKPLIGQSYINGQIWLSLRRHGFVNAWPVLRGNLTTENGQNIAIQGVDTLQWITMSNNMPNQLQQQAGKGQPDAEFSLSTLLVDSQFKPRLYSDSENRIEFNFEHEQGQPDIRFQEGIGLWAITDIAYADQLLNAQGKLSFIELSDLSQEQAAVAKKLLDGKAQLVRADQQNFDVLSQAFFFNLSALAMLGYVVAAFLSFNAIKLTLSAREKLLTQMHLLGCTKLGISVSLAVELIALSLLTALLGTLGGFVIANALVIDVNRTLVGLYQLDKALVVSWQWFNVLLGFALNLMALVVMLVAQTRRFAQQSNAFFYLILVVITALLIWLSLFAHTEFQALALCLCLMLLFVLLVPKCLRALLWIPLSLTNPLYQWLHADTRTHLKDLHIAIVAILVALGSAIGMQVMVKSFSETLNAHLEKQLSADIYLPLKAQNDALVSELKAHSQVALLSSYLQSEGRVGTQPTKLASYGKNAQFYQHISMTTGERVSIEHFKHNGCLANEQSAIKYGVELGKTLTFVQNEQHFTCRVSGFFYDYGNPSMSLLTLETRMRESGLHSVFYGYAIKLASTTSVAQFSEYLVNELHIDSTQITPNQRFKSIAKSLFDDTFVVTKALNGFILAIALASLCTSLLSLSAQQLKQLVVLRNLGVTRQQMLVMKLLQTAGIVLFTACFAIPLGLLLGMALLEFVMPIAFGWTIYFSLDVGALLLTCLTLVLVAVACAYLPVARLTQLCAKERS